LRLTASEKSRKSRRAANGILDALFIVDAVIIEHIFCKFVERDSIGPWSDIPAFGELAEPLLQKSLCLYFISTVG
jgi:hypothetical protein